MKQQNLMWPPKSTSRTSQLNVQIKSALSGFGANTTEYNYHTDRPKHWQTYKDPQVFQLALRFQLMSINAFKEVWRTPSQLRRKASGIEILSLPSGSNYDCHGNKLEMCLFPSCLTFIAVWGFLDFTLLDPSQKRLVKNVNYNLSYICGCTHVWLHNISYNYTRR